MKKVSSLLLIIASITGIFILKTPVNASNTKENYFIVTAYYSPLPNQKYYLKGDYEAEKRLNGQGIKGASGKKVFPGMLAAPKNYSFGTKIQLEGLGIGEISDRGGAIVNAGKRGYEHDRIDVWMGYGDEGLRRALYWGKRKVKGSIINSNSKLTLNYNKIPSPSWATKNLKTVPSIFNKGIGVKSDSTLIKKLQEFLSKINYYSGKIDGVYNSQLIDIIYNFQIKNNLIKNSSSYGAGYWGTKTRNLVLKKYLNGDFDKAVKKETFSSSDNQLKNIKNKELNIFNSSIKTTEEVKMLQEILKEMGLYKGKITGVYKDLTSSITDYQLENKIINEIGDAGTGYFGPKTRASLKKNYKIYLEEKAKKEELERIETERKAQLEKNFKELEELSKKEANKKIEEIGMPKIGEISQRVRKLQKTLKLLGFFTHKDTAIFGKLTEKAILSYQIDKALVKSSEDRGAGSYGPITKQSLVDSLAKKFLDEKIKKDIELSQYLNKQIVESEEEEVAEVYLVGDVLRF